MERVPCCKRTALGAPPVPVCILAAYPVIALLPNAAVSRRADREFGADFSQRMVRCTRLPTCQRKGSLDPIGSPGRWAAPPGGVRHGHQYPRSCSSHGHGVADPLDHVLDLVFPVAFGHHADHRFRA